MRAVIRVWSAAIVGVTLAVAVVPMLMLDASADDGAASMTALFGFPMVATAALIELHRPRVDGAPFVRGLLPWVGGLVVGMLFLGIPATLVEPDYYDARTLGGMLAMLGLFAFIMAFGVGVGILFWAIVVLPLGAVVRAAASAWRGEGLPSRTVSLAAGALVIEAVVVVIVVVVQREPERLVLAQIGTALLGLPGFVDWAGGEPPHLALWVLRALIVGLVVVAGLLTAALRAVEAQSQTR